MPDIARLAAGSGSAEELLRRAAAAIDRLVPVDGWCGLTLDPASLVKTGGVHESRIAEELLPRMIDLEYAVPDVNRFADLARQPSPLAVLHEATEGRPESSSRFRELMRPHGYAHELRLVLRERGRTWGGFTLLRGGRARPFSQWERRVLAELSSPLGEALRGLVRRSGGEPHPVESGLILLDRWHRVSALTHQARRLLEGWPGSGLPVPVHAVAARAWGSADPVRARTCSPAGGWLTVSAWRLDSAPVDPGQAGSAPADPGQAGSAPADPGEAGSAPAGAGQIAVSVEATRPEHLTPLLLDAYGLTEREQQVTDLVLRGLSTGEIASRLFLSPYTVQDHLRAVFDKIGVRSRPALVARLHAPQPVAG